jgi:hypothetical protein
MMMMFFIACLATKADGASHGERLQSREQRTVKGGLYFDAKRAPDFSKLTAPQNPHKQKGAPVHNRRAFFLRGRF